MRRRLEAVLDRADAGHDRRVGRGPEDAVEPPHPERRRAEVVTRRRRGSDAVGRRAGAHVARDHAALELQAVGELHRRRGREVRVRRGLEERSVHADARRADARFAVPVGHGDGHARIVTGGAAVARVDFPRLRREREERRAERRRAVEVRLFDVARADRLDAALFVSAAPRDGVRLEARRAVAEGERVAARREAELVGGRRRDVEREARGVAGRLSRIRLAGERRVVAADAVLPAVGQAAVEADRGLESAAAPVVAEATSVIVLTSPATTRLIGTDAVTRPPPEPLPAPTLSSGDAGCEAVFSGPGSIPSSRRTSVGRRSRSSHIVDGDRRRPACRRLPVSESETAEIWSTAAWCQSRCMRGLEAALVRDELVDTGGRRRQHEGAVGRGAHPRQRGVAEVVRDDEHAGDRGLLVTHDTGDRRSRRRERSAGGRDEQQGEQRDRGTACRHEPGPKVQLRSIDFLVVNCHRLGDSWTLQLGSQGPYSSSVSEGPAFVPGKGVSSSRADISTRPQPGRSSR